MAAVYRSDSRKAKRMTSDHLSLDHILAVDVGSSSVRAMLCDSQGTELPGTFVRLSYTFEKSADGGATLDADALLGQIFSCIDAVLATPAAAGVEIGTVAIDTFVSNVVGLDSNGAPVTPLYTWSDARGDEVIPPLKAQLDPQAYLQRTGCYLHPSYWPVRLAWLRESDPAAFGRATNWVSIGAIIFRRIFGTTRTSLSAASWSGLLNRHTLDWDAETLDVLGVSPEQLAQASEEPLSGLDGEWAARWPQLREALWYPAIGDGVASNIGKGCNDPSTVALALGTSGAMRLLMRGTPETIPDGLFCYRADAERSLIGGALSNVGNYYQWLRSTLHFDLALDVEAAVAVIEPDSHGLTVLPFLAGERSPFWDGTLPVAITGMTSVTTSAEILRAGLEATAFGFWRVWERLKPLAAPDAQIMAGGGASSKSPAMMQILADVLGAPVHAALERESTLRGAALFASGEITAHDIGRTYTPNMTAHAIYAAAIARQERLLEKLRVESA
jgi:gluconokinase